MELKVQILLFSCVLICLVKYAYGWGAACSGGPPGPPGPPGPAGADGPAGEGELLEYSNWRQCAYVEATGTDNGLIKTCSFKKLYSNTALYVAYGGNMRSYGCSGCCIRWFFRFNGNECSNPTAIDGIIYQTNTHYINLHRHYNVEGICQGLSAGDIDVSYYVGACSGHGYYDAYTGWNSASRIIIQEISPSPY
ncbi:collagen triple helix repeat-containing protein 1-like [Glandiceps talaboti]